MKRLALLLLCAACRHGAAPATPAPTTPAAATPSTPSPACAAPEYRQFDFWDGDWTLVVRARATPDGPWGEAHGTQHVESILGGCATAEHFAADGPQAPWAGASYSSWQPAVGKWEQTWVDDSG